MGHPRGTAGRHRSNRIQVISGPELRQLKSELQDATLFHQSSSVATFDRRAVLLLGISTDNLSRDLDDDERKVVDLRRWNTPSTGRGNPNANIINESGLYSLIRRLLNSV